MSAQVVPIKQPEPLEGSPGWEYVPGGGPLWKPGRGGPLQVLSSTPTVTERLVEIGENGKPANLYVTVRWGADEQTVPLAELSTVEGWARFPDARGIGAKATRDVLVNVVLAEAARLEREQIVTRSGFHAGRFVWPDGRVNRPGPGAQFRLFGLPEATVRAARPPGRTASDAEIGDALRQLGTIGAPPLIALGAGARSFGYGILPAPTGLVLCGERFAGKTSSAHVGRMPAFDAKWPPTVTAPFSFTPTRLELAIAREADVPTLIDDLAIAGDASEAELRVANAKLELILRAAANQTEMRGRATRDLFAKPGNYVRSIPMLTAQALPPTVQESLLRRCVVMELAEGDVDTGWLKANASGLWAPLRTLGERIVSRLELAADAEALLAEIDAEARRLLGRELDRAMPRRSDLADSIGELAAYFPAGLLLVADAAGLERAPFAKGAVEYLAGSLTRQVRRMAGRHAAAESLSDAVGAIVRRALHEHRAHVVRQRDGALALCVPGQTATAHGYRERWRRPAETDVSGAIVREETIEYEGAGPAFYWLEQHSAIGGRDGLAVRSRELHMLLSASRDGRVRSIPPDAEALADELLDAEALVETTQKGKRSSVQVKVEGRKARLIVLRPELVFDLPEPEGDGPDGTNTVPLSQDGGTGGTGGTAQLRGHEGKTGAPEAENALTSEVPPVPPVPPAESRGAPIAPEQGSIWERMRGAETIAQRFASAQREESGNGRTQAEPLRNADAPDDDSQGGAPAPPARLAMAGGRGPAPSPEPAPGLSALSGNGDGQHRAPAPAGQFEHAGANGSPGAAAARAGGGSDARPGGLLEPGGAVGAGGMGAALDRGAADAPPAQPLPGGNGRGARMDGGGELGGAGSRGLGLGDEPGGADRRGGAGAGLEAPAGAAWCERHHAPHIQLVPGATYCVQCHREEMNARGLANYPAEPESDHQSPQEPPGAPEPAGRTGGRPEPEWPAEGLQRPVASRSRGGRRRLAALDLERLIISDGKRG
jgi:hypothetical protein